MNKNNYTSPTDAEITELLKTYQGILEFARKLEDLIKAKNGL